MLTGSVGLAGSANIGDHCSMFEAIHGSAPRRAGQNLANPSGLLHGAILMLVHIGQAVLSFGGPVDYFVNTVFNYPTLAECYKTAAFDGINRLGIS